MFRHACEPVAKALIPLVGSSPPLTAIAVVLWLINTAMLKRANLLTAQEAAPLALQEELCAWTAELWIWGHLNQLATTC